MSFQQVQGSNCFIIEPFLIGSQKALSKYNIPAKNFKRLLH